MKEPRGFLRVIQFVLSIFAFATICTSATAHVNVKCYNVSSTLVDFPIKYSYPFDLHDLELNFPCGKSSPVVSVSVAPAAQFFCFIGVMSFLLCIAYVVGYIVFSPLFVNDSRAATADFIFSAVWTVLWFIASTAWADKLNSLGTYLDPSRIIAQDLKDQCEHPVSCSPGEAGSHATLVVSVLFGFLNMLVWGAGLWFLFKETRWHKDVIGDTQPFDQPHGEEGTGGTGGAGGSYQTPDPNTTPTY